jgi:hypothetical protein
MKSSSSQPPNVSDIVATQRRLTELSIRLSLESRETADRELLKETLGRMKAASRCLDQAWQRLTAGRIRVTADR